MNSNLGYCILLVWAVIVCLSKVFASSPCFFWDDARYLDGYCYKVFNVSKTWTEAQSSCARETYPSNLAEPMEEDSIILLRDITFSYDHTSFWLGGLHDSTSGTFKWASSDQAIHTESLVPAMWSDNSKMCVQLEDEGWRNLGQDICNKEKYHICQKYVGDVCRDTIPGADFYNGYCFKLQNTFLYYIEAKAACESSNSFLAEPQTEELYSFLEDFVNRKAEIQVFSQKNSEYVDLKTYGFTLEGRSRLEFYLTACKEARMALWEETSFDASSNPSIGSNGNIGGANGKYYEIIIDQGNKSYFKFCNNDSCTTLQEKDHTVLNCKKAIKFTMVLGSHGTIDLDQIGIGYHFREEGMENVQLNRMAVSMGNSKGAWLFQGGIENTDIFLGATDWDEEGVFTWLTNKKNVSLNHWGYREPNDYQPANGEDELEWRHLDHQLNDINGSTTTGRFICQKEAHKFTYVAVLPVNETGSSQQSFIDVTTSHTDFVFISVKVRTGTSVTKTTDWITADEGFRYDVDPDIEMTDTGINSGSVEILTNFEVTVVLHYRDFLDNMESTLIFPVNNLAAEYFVLASYEPKSGSQFTVTALQDNTEVTIKIPDYEEGVVVTLKGVSYRIPRFSSTNLDKLQSFQLQTTGDVSGCFIYSKKPAVVYVGSKGLQTSGQSTDINLDTLLPVNSLASHYITFPSIPLSDTQSDSFRVMAVFDKTKLKVHGPNTQNIKLKKSSNIQEISLPRNGFYVIEGPYQFYAMKTAKEAACISSLLPSTMWREQYDFIVRYPGETILIVIATNEKSNILLDDKLLTTELKCLPVKATSFSGCYFNPGTGLHHLSVSTPRTKFAAYSFYTGGSSHSSGYCHPLGVHSAIATYHDKIFDSESYIAASDCTPTLHPNGTVSGKEIEELQKAIVKKLRVDTKTTSAFRRTKESAGDERTSSKTIGATGIALITITLLLLVSPDVLRLIIYFSKFLPRQ